MQSKILGAKHINELRQKKKTCIRKRNQQTNQFVKLTVKVCLFINRLSDFCLTQFTILFLSQRRYFVSFYFIFFFSFVYCKQVLLFVYRSCVNQPCFVTFLLLYFCFCNDEEVARAQFPRKSISYLSVFSVDCGRQAGQRLES